MSNWTLFSNHGHVLFCLARDPHARLRDVAADVGITERAVQKIVRDLHDGGMVSISKHGRRNRYRIHGKSTLRHELVAHCQLGELVRLVNDQDDSAEPAPTAVTIIPAKPEPARPIHARQELTSTGKHGFENENREEDKSSFENSIEKQQGSLF